MCGCDFPAGSAICMMPGARAGKGCTTGATMTIRDTVAPNVAGADIGRGLYPLPLDAGQADFARFGQAAHDAPSGCRRGKTAGPQMARCTWPSIPAAAAWASRRRSAASAWRWSAAGAGRHIFRSGVR